MKERGSRFAWAGVSVALSLLTLGPAVAGPNGPAPGAHARAGIVAKASGVSLTAINLTVDTCNGVSGTVTVNATGTTDDGGGNDTVWFTIYDDGIEKFARAVNIPVGSSTATPIAVSYPGQVGSSAPGVALQVGEARGDGDLVVMDPFFPTQVGGCSALGATASVPTLSAWSTGGVAGLLALIGLGALYARRRGR